MKFVELIESCNYKIIEQEKAKIIIKKDTEVSTSIIVFNMEMKYINFMFQTKQNINNELDMDYLANDLNSLKKDLQTFKELSKYRII